MRPEPLARLLALLLVPLAAPGAAAGCTVTMTLTNPNPHPVAVFAETRAAPNPAWVGVMPGRVTAVQSWVQVPPRSTREHPIRLPGPITCRGLHELRVFSACLHSQPPHQFSSFIEREYAPWGPGRQTPRGFPLQLRY
jgi:hypothetical protein